MYWGLSQQVVSRSACQLPSANSQGRVVCDRVWVTKCGETHWSNKRIRSHKCSANIGLVGLCKREASALSMRPARYAESVTRLKDSGHFQETLTAAVSSTIWGDPGTVEISESHWPVVRFCQTKTDFCVFPHPLEKTVRAENGASECLSLSTGTNPVTNNLHAGECTKTCPRKAAGAIWKISAVGWSYRVGM